jgi:hypothetical protein
LASSDIDSAGNAPQHRLLGVHGTRSLFFDTCGRSLRLGTFHLKKDGTAPSSSRSLVIK